MFSVGVSIINICRPTYREFELVCLSSILTVRVSSVYHRGHGNTFWGK